MLIFLNKKYNTIFIQWLIFIIIVFMPTSIVTYRNYKYNESVSVGHNPVNAHIAWGKDKYGIELNSLGFSPLHDVKNLFIYFLKSL